ncbi:hypothetical protein [Cellulomonas sp.]|uniref:hypothetical protein n=1 Tax=Cellulomonas sp. TaxID=40001 RepID=UPI001B1788C2|nr:hypothetical protein [Cellulomonas sp.]MBO9555588.1 hypothetical protein [Cellulomonas sp.]
MSETIETPEALDALPVHSVVLAHWPSGEHEDHRIARGGRRGGAGSGGWTIADEATWARLLDWGATLTVLHRPDAPAPSAEDRGCDHAESLYGRCTACGMTWKRQTRQPAPVGPDLAAIATTLGATTGWSRDDALAVLRELAARQPETTTNAATVRRQALDDALSAVARVEPYSEAHGDALTQAEDSIRALIEEGARRG